MASLRAREALFHCNQGCSSRSFGAILDMFGLYAEETRASVKIHQRAVQTRPNKNFFQFIK
jgi:hypothetical protein